MAKSSFEKALEKQQKDAKRLAEKQQREEKRRMEEVAIRARATAIISGQPIVGNMRIMDASAEEILKIILSKYDGNEQKLIQGDYDCFPEAYHSSIKLEFEKLSMYGMISNPHVWIDAAWELTLMPQAITYFKDKESAQEKADNITAIQKKSAPKQYDVFISHANKDKSEYVDLLYMALKRLGVNIFMTPKSYLRVIIGKKLFLMALHRQNLLL